MTDTARTQAALLALGTEGVANSWSYQDQRDFIVSAIPSWWTYVHTPGSESVTFAGEILKKAAPIPASLGNPLGNDAAIQLQAVTFAGGADGGNYTLIFQGQETASIAWNEDPTAKLEALSTVPAGSISWQTEQGNLTSRYLIFFVGDLGRVNIQAGVDMTVGTQGLTHSGSATTLNCTQWETAAAATSIVPIAQLAVDAGVLSEPMLYANVGTVVTPDWRAINGLYFADPVTGIPSAHVSLGDGHVAMTLQKNGQIVTKIDIQEGTVQYRTYSREGGNTIIDRNLGAQAAFVANGSTVNQLRDSLIAAGIMAAS